jgi:hypothetical protein
MLSENEPAASKVADAMQSIYERTDTEFHIYVSDINPQGVA